MKWIAGVIVLASVASLLTGCEREENEPVLEEVAAVEPASLAPELIDSVIDGNVMKITQALADGFDVRAQDDGKRTLLMFAAFEGQTELVKLLIESGSEVNQRDAVSRTALMFASTGPYVDTVKLLIDNGAEVNAIDNHEDWTALMFAASEGHVDVVNLLLANGADVTMKDTDGEDALYFARQRGHEALAQMLEKRIPSK
jgi:uncharacterized protein